MRFLVAIAVSVGIHLLLAFGIWMLLGSASGPDVAATLDLSSVELSFAETEDESAAVAPRTPVAESSAPVPEMLPSPEPPPVAEPIVHIPAPAEIPRPAPPRPDLSSAPAPRQARIDAPPRPNRAIKPDYPKGARQRGEQGDVVVEMLVNVDGSVGKAVIIASSGFAELDEAALRAVCSAKFTPAKSGRESVASTARLTLTFKLK